MKYLIIAAHPDDEVLGCGGSIAKWTNQGHEVKIIIIAEGLTSRSESRNLEIYKEKLVDLHNTSFQAANLLGASTELLSLPDNRLDSLDLLDIIKLVEKKINEYTPDIIVTHHIGDLNIDHRLIHESVLTACRPQPDHKVKRLMSFEVPSSTEWQSSSDSRHFVPNWFENIDSTILLKIKALEIYKSEMRDWPHARSIDGVRSLAMWRGASIGCEYAEAFMLVRNYEL